MITILSLIHEGDDIKKQNNNNNNNSRRHVSGSAHGIWRPI